MVSDKGVILMGEAARDYVQFKYVELFSVLGLFVCIAIVIFYIFFRLRKED